MTGTVDTLERGRGGEGKRGGEEEEVQGSRENAPMCLSHTTFRFAVAS